MAQAKGQRVFDLVLVLATLPFWLPLLVLTALSVRVGLGRPVLFTQDRPGLSGRVFRLYKFRTLTNETDAHGRLLPDAERMTALGQLLRATSLDELPELWNILRGDMSLVGPRPLLVRYLERYSAKQAERHTVRPGLTGWAQIQGRNAISWEEKLALDIWYVRNRSLWLDLKILALTVVKVLRREGISAVGAATTTEFMGSPPQAPEPEALVDPRGRLKRLE